MSTLTDAEKESERHLRSWIIDGIRHRQVEFAEPVPDSIEVGGIEIPVIATARPDPDEWICDFCNNVIPIVNDEGVSQFIPLMASYALCPSCMLDCLTTDERTQMEAGFRPAIWSEQACACDGCVEVWNEIVASRTRHPSNGAT